MAIYHVDVTLEDIEAAKHMRDYGYCFGYKPRYHCPVKRAINRIPELQDCLVGGGFLYKWAVPVSEFQINLGYDVHHRISEFDLYNGMEPFSFDVTLEE